MNITTSLPIGRVVEFPRWVKVNTLMTKLAEVRDQLTADGWTEIILQSSDYAAYLDAVKVCSYSLIYAYIKFLTINLILFNFPFQFIAES